MSCTPEEVVNELQERTDPAFSTSEIADMFDMTVDGMRRKLKKLEANGELQSKPASLRCTIWWLPCYEGISGSPRNADNQHQ